MKKKNARLLHLIFAGVQNMTFKIKNTQEATFVRLNTYCINSFIEILISIISYDIRNLYLVGQSRVLRNRRVRWHLVIEVTQGMGSNFQVKADRRSSDSSQITHLEDFLKQVIWVTRTSDISF